VDQQGTIRDLPNLLALGLALSVVYPGPARSLAESARAFDHVVLVAEELSLDPTETEARFRGYVQERPATAGQLRWDFERLLRSEHPRQPVVGQLNA
jgi:hypothetical protein